MPDSSNKPVIFLAFANDRDDTVGYLRNLPNEARRLRDALQPAEQAGLCEVVVRSNSTAADIFKVFQDPKYRNRVAIFHYGGHANGYQLLLESSEGQSAAADAGGLAGFLAKQQGLQLVFLNGCSTLQQTQGLLDANISAVISTSRAIGDAVATDFSHHFYQGLAGGTGFQSAFDEAGAAVQTTKGSDTRALYFGDVDKIADSFESERLPWLLSFRAGAEHVAGWNLPNAVDDPLFGLPSLPAQDLPASPYRHLKWFTRQDAEVFFGRGHQIRELYNRLTAPRTAPILLFYGQSGVGKSSILDAGLIPRLEQEHEVRYLRRAAGGLLVTLRSAFAPEASDAPLETAWCAAEEQLGKPLIVFLDQVEELYTQPLEDVPDELAQLLAIVKATFVSSDQRPRGKLVLGFRKEWLAELEAQLADSELPRTKVFLEPLDRRGIIEVVQGPARSLRLRDHYGLTIEDGLAEIIADDLTVDKDSAIAPTLQILLTKMWNKATEANYDHPEFSQDLYQQLRRDGILLRDFLNQQIATFRQRYPEAVDSGLLLDIVALHTTPLGTADQQSVEHLRQQYMHLEATLPELLQKCQDLHLLTVATSSQKESTKTTRLAHDTLAPLVREQFDVSDKPGQRARRILDNRSVDWVGDQKGVPLDEADLAVVERGVKGTHTLTPTEERLLAASRALRAKLLRTRQVLKIAAVVAVTIIAVTACIALWQRGVAVENARIVQEKSDELAEKHQALATTNKQLDAKRKEALEALAEADTNRGLARELMSDLVPKVTTEVDLAPEQKSQLAEASRTFFEEFVAENSLDGTPNPQTFAVLADAKYVIGRIYHETEEFELAIQAYQQAYGWQCHQLGVTPETIAELPVNETNEGLANDVGYTLIALGHAYRSQGMNFSKVAKDDAKAAHETAKDRYSDAALLREKLTKLRPAHVNYRLYHASAVMNIGLAENNLPDIANPIEHLLRAVEQYRKADAIRQKLWEAAADKSEKQSIERHIAYGYQNLAVIFRKLPDGGPEAKSLATKAVAFYKGLPQKDEIINSELAKSYRLLGQTSELPERLEAYNHAYQIGKKLFTNQSWISDNQRLLFEVAYDLSRAYEELAPDTLVEQRDCWKSIKEVFDFKLGRAPDEISNLDRFGLSSLKVARLSQKIDEPASFREQLAGEMARWQAFSERESTTPEYQVIVDKYLKGFRKLDAAAKPPPEESKTSPGEG